ncbi:MAG: FtsQ-type POTRA domain-containing protein [Bacillota bacterium]|nr:FtsQ-type POTRA domain-containing protein [Bacillota bacterium]
MATYMYNEHDINQVKNMQKKIKKKKQKRRRCFVLVVLIIIACIVFMTGSASKVKKISISGCHLTNQESIIENISIKSKETYFFKVNCNQIEKEINQMLFVKKATVKKDLFGNVKITIQENNAMLYSYIDNVLYLVDEDGVMEKDEKHEKLSYVQRYPQAMNFDEKHLKQFIKEYKQLPSVIKNQISSIVFEPNDKDQTKCKLELDDGKIFYVRIEDMARQLTSTNYYLVIQKYPENKYYDFLGKNVYVYN